jgi:hypothetical protein
MFDFTCNLLFSNTNSTLVLSMELSFSVYSLRELGTLPHLMFSMLYEFVPLKRCLTATNSSFRFFDIFSRNAAFLVDSSLFLIIFIVAINILLNTFFFFNFYVCAFILSSARGYLLLANTQIHRTELNKVTVWRPLEILMPKSHLKCKGLPGRNEMWIHTFIA